MNKKLTMRLATLNDAQTIYSMYNSHKGYSGCTWNDEYPNLFIINEDITNCELYCLCDNEHIVAVASLNQHEDEFGHLNWNNSVKNPCFLSRVCVCVDKTNKGIGSLLLQKIIDISKENDFDSIRLLVSKENFSAINLYKKFNFINLGKTYMFNQNWYYYELVTGNS